MYVAMQNEQRIATQNELVWQDKIIARQSEQRIATKRVDLAEQGYRKAE